METAATVHYLFTVEPLHPDLRPYLRKDRRLGLVLEHPLIHSAPHKDALNGAVNARYRERRRRAEQLRQEGDWHGFVFAHEAPHRTSALIGIADGVHGESYWRLLRAVWQDTVDMWPQLQEWQRLFDAAEPGRRAIMSPAEQEVYARLPESVILWRGATRETALGLAWTLSEPKARSFAQSLHSGRAPLIVRARVPKAHVIAYLSCRGEEEVLALPENVEVLAQRVL